ncbi:hypothetical protein GCM10009537_18620 [Corynebacterium riegelii]
MLSSKVFPEPLAPQMATKPGPGRENVAFSTRDFFTIRVLRPTEKVDSAARQRWEVEISGGRVGD